MQIEKELAKVKPQKETLLTIGVFDGVHLGHKRLLGRLRDEARAKGWLSCLVTFKTHPETVVSPGNQLLWINDLESRISLIRDLGIDLVVALPFTSGLSRLTTQEFVRLLWEHLKMRGLIIGPDFALGKNREGNADKLRLLGREMGFSVEVVPPEVVDGEVVSSSAVRKALAGGDTKKAEKLLGRPFRLSGLVVSGDRRGRSLGFPTANLEVRQDQALPKDGIYVAVAYTDGEPLPSVTNIGVRPTFGGGNRLIETYLIDFEGDLRGSKLSIDLLDRLREEERFDSVEELKAQMKRDVEQARVILERRLGARSLK